MKIQAILIHFKVKCKNEMITITYQEPYLVQSNLYFTATSTNSFSKIKENQKYKRNYHELKILGSSPIKSGWSSIEPEN